MAYPVKHSLAVMIFKDDQVLAIRRPDDDDELPGVWGLPAGTYRSEESTAHLIERIGRDKLGVFLTPTRKVAAGMQNRTAYKLEMELWLAAMEGTPSGPEWKWVSVDMLAPGAASGSLCCELAIETRLG